MLGFWAVWYSRCHRYLWTNRVIKLRFFGEAFAKKKILVNFSMYIVLWNLPSHEFEEMLDACFVVAFDWWTVWTALGVSGWGFVVEIEVVQRGELDDMCVRRVCSWELGDASLVAHYGRLIFSPIFRNNEQLKLPVSLSFWRFCLSFEDFCLSFQNITSVIKEEG